MSTNPSSALQPIALQAAEGQTIKAFGDTVITKLKADDTHGAFSLGLVTTPSQGGPPLHRHTREDEVFLVISGQYCFVCDGTAHDVGPGGMVFL